MINNQTLSVGFYGKLPIIGDFVSRRLSDEFITPWDNWLQSAITASRETLGEAWLSRYLTCPIWQFLLSPGVCGKNAVAGIVMPSVDKVGRYFPLTLAVTLESASQLPSLFTVGRAWFEQLEEAALAGLDGKIDLSTFDQLIQAIPNCPLPPSQPFIKKTVENSEFCIALANFEQMTAAYEQLNAQLLANFMPGYSLWRNAGSEYVESTLLVYKGLPSIGSFAEFLSSRIDLQISPAIALQKAVSTNSHPMTNNDTENTQCPTPAWRSWAVTDIGKLRKQNEDALLSKPEQGLWVVADGMGGHRAGDMASQSIVSTLNHLSLTSALESTVKQIELSLQTVNTQLRQLAAEKYGNQIVGSTVVLLVCESARCAFMWAGDSRLYRFRHNQLQQLTVDHCEPETQLASRWQVKNTNAITRAVGADEALVLDSDILEAISGDIFLLCSDGLDKEVSFEEIEHIMRISKLEDMANTLIAKALERGARDNVTIVVVARS